MSKLCDHGMAECQEVHANDVIVSDATIANLKRQVEELTKENGNAWAEAHMYAKDILALEATITDLKRQVEEESRWHRAFASLVEDMHGDFQCEPQCDSYGHAAMCAATDPVAAFSALRVIITSLTAALEGTEEKKP